MHKNTRSRVFSGIWYFCFLFPCQSLYESTVPAHTADKGDEFHEKQHAAKIPVHDPYGTDDPDTLTVRAASVTDCTGLIPSGTDSDEVLESYAEIYHYPADIFHGS